MARDIEDDGTGPAPFLVDGPADAAVTVVLTHGAGGPMDSAFLERFAAGLAARGLRVVRFELPYMRRRRAGTGGRGAPDRTPVLEAAWLEVIARLGGGAGLVIGGKSMGGRIASHVADRAGARGLVCLGYPFHPPGQPEKLRTAHLAALRTPTLVVQGTRDPFGGRDEVATYTLSPAIRIEWLEGGDHSFEPARGSGFTAREHVETAIARVADFAAALA